MTNYITVKASDYNNVMTKCNHELLNGVEEEYLTLCDQVRINTSFWDKVKVYFMYFIKAPFAALPDYFIYDSIQLCADINTQHEMERTRKAFLSIRSAIAYNMNNKYPESSLVFLDSFWYAEYKLIADYLGIDICTTTE